ncbi:hypothetical protein ACWEJ6_46745, partial [Nonomuraea sp. NPDC004702]
MIIFHDVARALPGGGSIRAGMGWSVMKAKVERRIAVFGAGYIGLVTGACLAELGHRVVIRDIAPDKIRLLRAGAQARPGLLFTVVVVGGIAVIAAPWLAGL